MRSALLAMLRYFQAAVPFRLGPALITTAVWVTLLLIPAPQGLRPHAWSLVTIESISACERGETLVKRIPAA